MAWGTPASLGVASGSSAHSVTLSGVSVSAGDLIVICIAYRAKAYTDAILATDSAGNSYTVHKQQYSTTNVFGVAVAYAVATSALSSGSITVSDTASGSNNFTNAVFAAYSVSGGATSSPEDTSVLVSTIGGGQFGSGMNLTSGTPTQAGDLLFGLFNSTGLTSFSESPSWTTLVDRQQGTGFSNTNVSASYYVNSGSGAVTWNPTSGGSGAYVPIIIGFKIASAGGGSVGATSGTASAAAVGQSSVSSVASSSGTSTATATSSVLAQSHGSAAGSANVTAIGGSLADTTGSASGAATVTGIAESSVARASGISSVAGIGASIAQSIGTGSGSSIAEGIGAALFKGAPRSDGASQATGIGRAFFESVGSSEGASGVFGIGSALRKAMANTDGQAIVLGVSAISGAPEGNASGSANAFGVGSSLVGAIVNANGAATVAGFSSSPLPVNRIGIARTNRRAIIPSSAQPLTDDGAHITTVWQRFFIAIGEQPSKASSMVPMTASSPGSPGEIAWDSGHLYVCVSSNAWKRVSLSAW